MLFNARIKLNWKLKTGEVKQTIAHPGMNLLTAARAGNIDLEGSTCLILNYNERSYSYTI